MSESSVTTSEERRRYIREHFSLTQAGPGDFYIATWTRQDGSVFVSKDGPRAEVVRYARAHWGHMNFADEQEEFNKIFPARYC